MLNGCIVHAEANIPGALQPVIGRFSFADTPALTAALRAGDEAAYRWFYDQWHSRLSRYAFALARGNETLAGEIVQATYLRLVRHIRVLPDSEAFWGWLACAARSAAVDLGRTGHRYRNALSRFTDWLRGSPNPSRDSSDSSEASLSLALDAALAQLTPEERDLINARYFDPVPLEQTAARLNISVRAVEGRLARLRKRLRELITIELNRPRL
jgi:RNA polymerase sigma factor (sigma-70 family)